MRKLLIILAVFFLSAPAAEAADRYWVGGTANWDTTAGSKWALTSGGTGGEAVPTSSDDCYFDANSGAVTVTVHTGVRSCLNFDSTGFTGTLTGGGASPRVRVFGNLTLGAGSTVTNLLPFTFSATATGKTITTNGKTPAAVTFDGVGGGWTLQDDLITSGGTSVSLGGVTLTNGSVNLNDKNVTSAFGFLSSNSNTRTLTMGSGTFTIQAGTWDTGTVTGLTFNADASTIKYTNTAAGNTTFTGGGLTFNNLWFDRGASTGSITIAGSNTFNDFKDTGTAAHSTLFTAGTTQTVTTFSVSGSSGNAITINSAAGSTATHALVKTGGGTISSDYLNIQHSVATPASTWYAGVNSTNNQAVATAGSGWIFTAPPSAATAAPFMARLLRAFWLW